MLWLNELHIECIPFKCYTQNIIFGNTLKYLKNKLVLQIFFFFFCRFASEHNMSCQCKKMSYIQQQQIIMVQSRPEVWKPQNCLEQNYETIYAGFISYWMSASTIFYIQMISSQNVAFTYYLRKRTNQLLDCKNY